MFHGIDVSGWQGDIDWKAVAADDYEIGFALIRATEGGHIIETDSRGYLDRQFVKNWNDATEAGLIVGAYHVARVSDGTGTGGYELLMDARSEASWFWKILEEIGWDTTKHLPPVLELRWDKRATAAGITAAETLDWALEFISEMTNFCGRKPMVYSSPGFWKQMLLQDPRLSEFPLWESDIDNPAGSPQTLADWNWQIHQHSFRGTIDGITGNVGLNVFRGSKGALLRFIEAGDLPNEAAHGDWSPPGDLRLPILDLSAGSEPRGKAVERLQGLLLSHGYGPSGLVTDEGLPTGIGGPLTRDTVGRFQADAGLPQDYEVGPRTWWALIAKGLSRP